MEDVEIFLPSQLCEHRVQDRRRPPEELLPFSLNPGFGEGEEACDSGVDKTKHLQREHMELSLWLLSVTTASYKRSIATFDILLTVHCTIYIYIAL